MVAAKGGYVTVADLLLKHDVQVNLQTDVGTIGSLLRSTCTNLMCTQLS